MSATQKSDAVEAIRALCTGSIEWRVASDDGAYCMSFSRDDSHNPEQEANEWLATHLCKYPERFMAYKVRRVVVQSQLQEEALALITRLSEAQSALQAREAEIAALKLQLAAAPLYSTRLKARRYEWLRAQPISVAWPNFPRGDALDAAIDAARQATREDDL